MRLSIFKIRLTRWLLAYAPAIYGLLTRRNPGFGRVGGNRLKARPASAANMSQCRVLVVDHDFPELARDAGSKAIFHLAGLLGGEARVTFWSASSSPSEEGRSALQSIDVQTVARHGRYDLAQWLSSLGRKELFDAAILSRPIITAMYAGVVRKHLNGVCAYYGHDIHHVRLAGMKEFAPRAGLDAERRELGRMERRLWRTMDRVFYPSSEEVDIVNAFRSSLGLESNATMIPLWDAPEVPAKLPRACERSGMLFVGSFDHAPNVDGLDWFFREILPKVRKLGCRDTVYIVGSGMNQYRRPTDDLDVACLGQIDDESLDGLYARVRVALVPLRYGAGVKGKVVEAMGKGVPCVVTSAGAHGLAWASDVLQPCDDAETFAHAIIRLMTDDGNWAAKSTEGMRLLSTTYERSEISRRLFDALSL